MTRGVREGVEPYQTYTALWQAALPDVEITACGLPSENTEAALARLEETMAFGVTQEFYGSRPPYLGTAINAVLEAYAEAVRELGDTACVPVLEIWHEFLGAPSAALA